MTSRGRGGQADRPGVGAIRGLMTSFLDMLTATTTACPMKRALGIGLAGASSEAVPPLWWPWLLEDVAPTRDAMYEPSSPPRRVRTR